MMQLLADGATLATIASKENAIKMRESWTSMRQDDHEFHEEEVQELMQRMYDVICKCNTVFNLEMFKHWKVEAGELLLDQIFLCGSAVSTLRPTVLVPMGLCQLPACFGYSFGLCLPAAQRPLCHQADVGHQA